MRSETVKQIKKLAFRGAVFFVILLVLDVSLGYLVRSAYFRQENKYIHGILNTEADVIIVGSSRANSHYVPSVFKDSLGMSCFNLGSGGQNIYYYYGILGSILERYSPKVIIMDVMGGDIEERKVNTDRLSEFLPFYRSSKSIREMIDLRGPVERIKLLSGIYPFNSQVTSIVYSYLKKGSNPHLLMDGYIPLDGIISSPLPEVEREDPVPLDMVKVGLVEKIAHWCQQKKVRLVIIVSPRFSKFVVRNPSIESLSDIVSKYDVEVWDYEQDEYFLSRGDLFRDELHLNHNGAVEYTKMIASKIKWRHLTDN